MAVRTQTAVVATVLHWFPSVWDAGVAPLFITSSPINKSKIHGETEQNRDLVTLTSRSEATRGLFWDGPHNFEPRSDDEDDTSAAPPLQASTSHQREDDWPLRMISRATGPIHGGSSVESGLEHGILRPQSRDFTTRSPRPLRYLCATGDYVLDF
ncbi:hypothetical protein AVEN_5499-1 [Araneus ventricosus]|uniref:Uncharacterized protein n=1 Tax=Araneus ventricosus TaxID=182803 RepID=A0A4Y2JRC4_ARAVE|nr:hypothetical protein AVEN_5499-1 [Araneus ventricosus]